jgi:hypothetical protein
MEFEKAKAVLKDGYINAGLELVDEHTHELFLKPSRRGDEIIRISQEEIAEYAEFEQLRSDFKVEPVECSMCSSTYREHIVDFSAELDRRRSFFFGDRLFKFGEKDKNALYAEIGQASMLFINFFRFDEAYLQNCIERIQRQVIRRGVNVSLEMRDLLYKPLTVRVHSIQATSIESVLRRSNSVIDSCLFELSYLKGLPLTLKEEWPRRQPRVRPFQFGENAKGDQLPLPKVVFNSDIIRFYQRGMSTDDPVNQFLSFYQVLEYYFVTVSDEQLYDKLSRRINDPKFSTSSSNLDRLIQDTLTHKRETDETEMLKLVLNKFLDEAELIEFIKAYEEYLSDSLYTKRRTIFGESVEVKLDSGHIIGNIAKRVKIIRNALVHSSDRYERNQRYIPATSAEKMITREIPLIKYLCEKVIIASGQ